MIGVEDAKSVAEQLAERRVFVDWRPSAGLRISPHFFNTDEEVEEALQTLAGLIE
jgi:kynureninase